MRSILWWTSSLWSSLSVWNSVERISLFVVVASVAGEYIAESWKWPKGSHSRRRLVLWCGTILVVGLFAEMLATSRTISISGKEIAALDTLTAEANERAEEAHRSAEDERVSREKLEAQIADRWLTEQQIDDLAAVAKRYPGENVDFLILERTGDSELLAVQMTIPLQFGGRWKSETWYCEPTNLASGAWFDISVCLDRSNDSTASSAAGEIDKVLSSGSPEMSVGPVADFAAVWYRPIDTVPANVFGRKAPDANIKIIIAPNARARRFLMLAGKDKLQPAAFRMMDMSATLLREQIDELKKHDAERTQAATQPAKPSPKPHALLRRK